jgi:hypothetical protein
MMANTTEKKTHATTTTMEYFFAPSFARIENEPAYNELAEMLDEVKTSKLYYRTASGRMQEPGFITDDVKSTLMKDDLIIQNSLNVKYNKKLGLLFLRIPDVANIKLKAEDGWSEKFMMQLARAACKVVIGIVARSVNRVLVHDGIFYDNEKGSEYQWSGKPTCEELTVSEFDSKKFKIMGICKEEKPSVKYEADGDGFLFEDRQASNLYWAKHNTITGGYVDDDVMIHAFGASMYYGRI